MVHMAVCINHRHHRPLWPVLVIQGQRRSGHLGRRERVNDDQSGVTFQNGHVGQIHAANLVNTVTDLEQAGDHIEAGMSPQTGVHTVGRLLMSQETIGLQVPDRAAVGAQNTFGRQGCDQSPTRIVKRTVIVQGQMQPLGGLAGTGVHRGRLRIFCRQVFFRLTSRCVRGHALKRLQVVLGDEVWPLKMDTNQALCKPFVIA